MNSTKDFKKKEGGKHKSPGIPLPVHPKGKEAELPIKAAAAASPSMNSGNTIRIGLLPKEFKDHRNLAITQNDLCKKLLANLEVPDMVVCIGDFEFKVHSAIMQVYSDLFADRHARDKFVVLPENWVPPNIFQAIYHWMCTKEVSIDKEDVDKMIFAADFLRIGFLILNLKPYINIM